MKQKRLVYELRFSMGEWMWGFRGGTREAICGQTKTQAERAVRRECRRQWFKHKTPCQLLIHNRDGRIGKGGRNEASYGCDAKRRKG